MRVLVTFFLSVLCLYVNAQNIKIGFIDSEQVVMSLSQYKHSVDEISREFEPKKQVLLDLFNHIELLRKNIESNINAGNTKSFEIEISKLADLEKSFERDTELWQTTMNNKKINLLNKIKKVVNIALKEFAIEEGYDLILYTDVAYVSDGVDITQKIINKIEKQSP
jgi:outer membrane protein